MSNFKKMVQARIDKTGESWSTAAHHVRAPVAGTASPPPPPSGLARLLGEMYAPGTFTVQTGRVPAVGRSTILSAAQEQARRLAEHPQWYAETGRIQMTVTREDHELLVREGAANDTTIQMIRTFQDQVTFSERCCKCHRWIWCDRERSGTCFCGSEYRVLFDLAPVLHGSMAHNARCMDCGVERIMHPVSSGISPWHLVNNGQSQCNLCHAKAPAVPAKLGPAKAFRSMEVGVDGAPGPRHFEGECPKCSAPMSGVLPPGRPSIEFHCDKCGGKFIAARRDPI